MCTNYAAAIFTTTHPGTVSDPRADIFSVAGQLEAKQNHPASFDVTVQLGGALLT